MSNESKYWYLRNHHLFDELSRHEITELCYLSHFKTHRKGDIINLPQEEKRVFTLKVGIIKLVETDADGNEQLIEILRPDDIFGQFTLTPHSVSQHAVVLSDYVTFCSFLVSDFEAIMLQNPKMGLTYTKFIGLRLRKIENQYINLMFKDVRTRLRLFLKDWVRKEEKPGQPNVITNYLSHRDISRLICSNRQTVTELMNEFRAEGLLDYNRTKITITNPALLDV